MDLQSYVTGIVEALGGVVLPLEYALCQAMVPAAHAGLFQGREEILMAFDYEVSLENPGSEFITFGSHLLDTLMALVRDTPKSAVRYALVDRLAVGSPEDKIKKLLCPDSGKVVLAGQRPVGVLKALFSFRLAYTTDEREEEIQAVWVNLPLGTVEPDMSKCVVHYESQRPPSYPLYQAGGLSQAYEAALGHLEAHAHKRVSAINASAVIAKEFIRIKDYYEDLKQENYKRMNRKGLSQEKLNELKAKTDVLEMEKEKQLREISDKYTARSEIRLDHGILYEMPMLLFEVEIYQRLEKAKAMVLYDPFLKKFTAL